MEDTNSIDTILEFFQRNQFTRAEAALRSELSNRPDTNGFARNFYTEWKDGASEADSGHKQESGSRSSGEISKELIVKEIEYATSGNGFGSKWKNAIPVLEKNKEAVGTSSTTFTFLKGPDDTVLDLQSRKYHTGSAPVEPNDINSICRSLSEFQISEHPKSCMNEIKDTRKSNQRLGEEKSYADQREVMRLGNSNGVDAERKQGKKQAIESKEEEHKIDSFEESTTLVGHKLTHSSSNLLKESTIRTAFPFSGGDASTSYVSATNFENRDGKKKMDNSDIMASIKEQVDEVGRALYCGKLQGNSMMGSMNNLSFPLMSNGQKEDLPRLPPVKLKSEETLNILWEEKLEHGDRGAKLINADNTIHIGTDLDIPIGQEFNYTGLLLVEKGQQYYIILRRLNIFLCCQYVTLQIDISSL